MVRILFESRILCDYEFFKLVLTHQKKAEIMSRLMRIKSVSKEYKGEHNVILDFDYQKVRNLTKEPAYIRAAVKEVQPIDNKGHLDEITKRLAYAIFLASQSPFATFIFTSMELKKNYENHHLFKGMKSVKIKANQEAIDVINDYFRRFTWERESTR